MRARSVLVFCVAIATVRCSLPNDQQFWEYLAQSELHEALGLQWNLNTAKNVIVFIGDGMGPNTVTATRIYQGGETHRLSYEKFPHMGLIKTYSANKMVPDSASTSTAIFCGVKVNQETTAVDASVANQDCISSLRPEARLDSIAAKAIEAGKSAGFVTTMRVTHATPAPLYAHSAHRGWECDGNMPAGTEQCKDIARQLVEEWPGKEFNVILGGGRQLLTFNATEAVDPWSCSRRDQRNLVSDYISDKQARGKSYNVVYNNRDLMDVDLDNTDFLLGLFASSHMSYEFERNKGPDGQPSISEMVEAAIKVLRRNENGYFLMVEGGNVDMAHHRGRAKTAIDEAAAMELAVQKALSMTDEAETLIIVTSDHTHTLSINGYPYRGSSIFGIAPPSPYDGINYTTLSYATGGPGAFQFYAQQDDQGDTKVLRREASLDDTEDFYYEQVAGIRLDENSHGGGDVAIYARGPHAHLFHNVHEQHYIFHAVSYAAKIGAHSTAVTHTGALLMCITAIVISIVI